MSGVAAGGLTPYITKPPKGAPEDAKDEWLLFYTLTTLLGIPDNENQYLDHPIVKALMEAEVTTWQGDFLTLSRNQIDNLKLPDVPALYAVTKRPVTDASGRLVYEVGKPLATKYITNLHMLTAYYHVTSRARKKPAPIHKLGRATFRLFLIDYDPNEPVLHWKKPTKEERDRTLLWQKTVQPRMTDVDEVKVDYMWPVWKPRFERWMRACGLSGFIKKNFKHDDLILAGLQATFVITVLDKKVLIPSLRHILIKHRDTEKPIKDCVKCWFELVESVQKSMSTDLIISRLITYITSVRLAEINWRGTQQKFLSDYNTQVQFYRRIVDKADDFQDHQYGNFLMQAVTGVPNLENATQSWRVNNVANAAAGNPVVQIAYQDVLQILLQHAQVHDSKNVRSKQVMRDVNAHEFDSEGYDLDEHQNEESVIEACITDTRHGKPNFNDKSKAYLDSRTFSQLSSEDRSTWTKLSPQGRALLIHGSNAQSGSPKTGLRPSSKSNGSEKRSVNEHQTKDLNIDANEHNVEDTEKESERDEGQISVGVHSLKNTEDVKREPVKALEKKVSFQEPSTQVIASKKNYHEKGIDICAVLSSKDKKPKGQVDERQVVETDTYAAYLMRSDETPTAFTHIFKDGNEPDSDDDEGTIENNTFEVSMADSDVPDLIQRVRDYVDSSDEDSVDLSEAERQSQNMSFEIRGPSSSSTSRNSFTSGTYYQPSQQYPDATMTPYRDSPPSAGYAAATMRHMPSPNYPVAERFTKRTTRSSHGSQSSQARRVIADVSRDTIQTQTSRASQPTSTNRGPPEPDAQRDIPIWAQAAIDVNDEWSDEESIVSTGEERGYMSGPYSKVRKPKEAPWRQKSKQPFEELVRDMEIVESDEELEEPTSTHTDNQDSPTHQEHSTNGDDASPKDTSPIFDRDGVIIDRNGEIYIVEEGISLEALENIHQEELLSVIELARAPDLKARHRIAKAIYSMCPHTHFENIFDVLGNGIYARGESKLMTQYTMDPTIMDLVDELLKYENLQNEIELKHQQLAAEQLAIIAEYEADFEWTFENPIPFDILYESDTNKSSVTINNSPSQDTDLSPTGTVTDDGGGKPKASDGPTEQDGEPKANGSPMEQDGDPKASGSTPEVKEPNEDSKKDNPTVKVESIKAESPKSTKSEPARTGSYKDKLVKRNPEPNPKFPAASSGPKPEPKSSVIPKKPGQKPEHPVPYPTMAELPLQKVPSTTKKASGASEPPTPKDPKSPVPPTDQVMATGSNDTSPSSMSHASTGNQDGNVKSKDNDGYTMVTSPKRKGGKKSPPIFNTPEDGRKAIDVGSQNVKSGRRPHVTKPREANMTPGSEFTETTARSTTTVRSTTTAGSMMDRLRRLKGARKSHQKGATTQTQPTRPIPSPPKSQPQQKTKGSGKGKPKQRKGNRKPDFA